MSKKAHSANRTHLDILIFATLETSSTTSRSSPAPDPLSTAAAAPVKTAAPSSADKS